MRARSPSLSPFRRCAQAQAFPNKPIRIIVPYAAGGTSDILARRIAPSLHEASASRSSSRTSRARTATSAPISSPRARPTATPCCSPTSAALVISPSVYPKLPFDPSKDFAPVVMVSYSPHVLAVHPSVPVANREGADRDREGQPRQAELRRSPASAARRSSRASSSRSAPACKWTYIPYKGGAHARDGRDRRTGERAVQRHARHLAAVTGGKLKALAISSAQRVPPRPTRPPSPRQGLPGLRDRLVPGRGRRRPARRARPSLKLNAELAKALNTAGHEGALRQAGHRGAHRARPRASARGIRERAGALGEGGEGLRREVRMTQTGESS